MTMRFNRAVIFTAMVAVLALSASAFAAVPKTVALEGILTSSGGGAAADGKYSVTFKIYANSSTTTPLWAEGPVSITLTKGQFHWALGSKTALDVKKLTSTSTPFLGIKIGSDPELPRRPLHSVLYALNAATASSLTCTGCISAGQVANGSISGAKVGFNYAGSTTKGGPAKDLACTGCVSVKELKFDGNIDLGGFSFKAKNGTFTGAVAAATVTATSFIGDGSKLTGIKTPSGECKTAGDVVKGINADGSLKCVKAMDPNALPKDGLNEISNDLLSNQFTDTIETAQKMVLIPDNTGSDAVSNIIFPNIGITQKFSMYVHVENTDLAKVSMVVLPPNDKKVGWTLCDPCGATKDKVYKKTFSPTAKPKSGDIGKMVGTNVQGLWTLKVTDTAFCQPQILADLKWCKIATKSDGWIATWKITIQTLSNQKIALNGDQYTSGSTNVGGDVNVAKNTTIGGDLTLKGDLKGLSTAPSVAPLVSSSASAYFGVISVRNPAHCPKGWNVQNANQIRGSNNYVYININSSGLTMGGAQSNGHSQHYIYQGYNVSNNGGSGSTVCWKEFKAPAGKPHVHILAAYDGPYQQGKCPAKYTYISHNNMRGNNDHTYFQAGKSGFYMGYVDTWSYGCTAYNEDGEGCQRRYWQSDDVRGVCFRVYGTTDDVETQNGVFPVVLGMHFSSAGCPSGWNLTQTANLSRSDNWAYNTATANSSYMGGHHTWGYTAGYRQNHFHSSYVKYMCWKMLPITNGKPTATLQQRRYDGGCPSGFINLPWNSMRGWNNHAYYQLAVRGLYFGGLHSWTHADHSEGYIANTYNDTGIKNFCLKISHVKM
ncbi:MAG: hypothetical protein KC502_03965 [Myxococcales bacterium]|nr:hypothetical protein [Myxococcales bacterium]